MPKKNEITTTDKKNAQLLKDVLPFMSLDVPITAEEYIKTTEFYFSYCLEHNLKPGIEGLCACYGISSKRFFDICERDIEFDPLANICSKARQTIMAYYEQLNTNGRLNPAMGIFLLKNWGNYKDEKRVQQTTLQIETKASAEKLEEKYLKDLPDAEFKEI